MSSLKKWLVALLVNAWLIPAPVLAVTPDEAKGTVDRALAEVKASGPEQAYAKFTSPTGGFVKGELYVFVVGLDGAVLAHGGNPKMVGKSLTEMRTADGKLLLKEYLDVVNGKGEGWVDYKWSNPETKKVQDKTTFIKKIPGVAAFAGCGIYK